jgi:hypothetical protein
MAYGKIKADALVHDNNGSDVETSISDLVAKADLGSPTFTGTPAAPTAAQGTNTTQIATTAFVNAEIAADTADKAPLASPTFTGTVTIPAGATIGDIGTTIQAFDADTAKTDVAQTYTAGQRGELTTVTSSSGVLDIDFNDSNNFYIELSEPLTSITATNPAVGQSGSIFIKQPASGGPHTVGGWASAYLFSAGAAPSITQTASKCDRVDYVIRSATEIQVVWTGNY